MLGYFAAAIGIAMIAKTVMMIDDWGRDWTSNHAAFTADHPNELLRPVVSDHSPAQVADAISSWASKQSKWSVVTDTTSDSLRRMHLTHTTSAFRFVDDVHLEISQQTDAAGKTQTFVHAESQSRVGKGDLGQNPRNLKMLHEGVRSELLIERVQ